LKRRYLSPTNPHHKNNEQALYHDALPAEQAMYSEVGRCGVSQTAVQVGYFAVYPLFIRGLSVVYPPFIRCLSAVYPPFIRCLSAVYPLFSRRLSAVYPRFFRGLFRCLSVAQPRFIRRLSVV